HALDEAVGAKRIKRIDAVELASRLLGDAIYANPLMLGFAWQSGWIPLTRSSLRRAIELNEVQVENNLIAFEWGRRVAHDASAVMRLVTPAQPVQWLRQDKESVEALIAKRQDYLRQYQDEAYAQRYVSMVRRVQAAERALGSIKLTEAVARNLFKLMAYKDEYEVARLLTDEAFRRQIDAQFEGGYKLAFNLAPPWLAARDASGQPAKRRLGSGWVPVLKWLTKLKALRGTWLDPFAYSDDRRLDRSLLHEYQERIEHVLAHLKASNLPRAIEIASMPDVIRGYGHVRAANARKARDQWRQLQPSV
ncbi:MAG TPA: DUF6537 domain-containing protein, partial [Aquabacterium sp.]|nr:DUF6537 domain-containing protein [Aquabacterium sp.]